MTSSTQCAPTLLTLLAACLLLVSPQAAAAATRTFQAQVQGVPHTATVELKTRQGIDYVSLVSLTQQFGGGFDIWPTRVKLDLAAQTVWVQINDKRVKAATVITLEFPVLRHEQDVLIALSDVVPLFSKAFGISVNSAAEPPAQTASPTRPPPKLELRPTTIPATGGPVGIPAQGLSGPRHDEISVIVIDPGHGSYDGGVQGRAGFQEKRLALRVALKLEAILKGGLEQEIVLTRREDIGLSLKQRADLAESSLGDLLITIHAGGAFSSAANGVAILYPTASEGAGAAAPISPYDSDVSRQLAEAIGAALTGETAAAMRGIQAAPCRLMTRARIPGVLIEVGCLTNPSEEALMEMDSYQGKLAQGIASGLKAYLDERRAAQVHSGGQPLSR